MSIHLSLPGGSLDPNSLVQAFESATRFVPEIHWFEVTFPNSFAPLSLYHKLGKVPVGMVQDPMIDAIVWAEPDDRKSWGLQRVVLRCNAENATVRVGLVL